MSEIDWDWRTWLKNHPRCQHCHESILDNKLVRVFGKPYHYKCWKKLNERYYEL